MAERARAAPARGGHPAPLPARPGTYLLILETSRRRVVQVGALGPLDLSPGVYVYVGSARGPGGLAARVGHHRRRARAPRWHIDAVRRHTAIREVWYAEDPLGFEHEWAALLGEMPAAVAPLPRFGASDCRCASHLFRFDAAPPFAAFRRRARRTTPSRPPALHRWRPPP